MKKGIEHITEYLEYLLLLAVILECNSIYGSAAQTASAVSMPGLLRRLALLLTAALLALRVAPRGRGALRTLAPDAALLAALIAYAGAFYFLNVRRAGSGAGRAYCAGFMLFLPMLVALFKLKRREGRPFDLLFKHSDIMCVLAAMSLVVWLASVARPDTMPSDVIYSRWTGRGLISEQTNLLDVCQFAHGAKWQVFGIALLRNRGPFGEPLMFALPLLVALFTELFLREAAYPWRPWRWLLLSATLVTVNATIGLMLLALAWGLKGVAVCLSSKRRWLVLPILLAAVCACGVLYMEKDKLSNEDTEVSSSSLGVHIDDYRVSLRAFKDSPLVGNGYENEKYIQGYMSAWRLKKNFGLSNSAGVILAEGGLMLGLMCLMPFGVALMYLFGRRNRRVACWAAGPLAAMLGIIFKYRLFMLLLMAFGYSLVDVKRPEAGRMRLALANLGSGAEERPAGNRRRIGWIARIQIAACAALVAFGGPLWQALRTFLRGHRFSVGQSPLGSFCFAAVVLLHGVFLRAALRRELSFKRVAGLLAWDAVYLLAYPLLCSGANTLLSLWGLWGELRECALLLLIYFAAVPAAALASPGRWLNRRGVALAAALAAAVGLASFAALRTLDGAAARADALAPALQALADRASGRVYVDELPLLYRRRVKGLSLAAAHGTGYDVCENASVVFPMGVESRELLEAGFELAALTEDALVYTNDPAVVAALSGEGASLYRYYPFEKDVDLAELAEQNGLSLAGDGALVAEGPLKSPWSGPGDTLYEGQYTLRYVLRIDPSRFEGMEADALVCRLAATRNGGDLMNQKQVSLGKFDAEGNAVVELPFKLGSVSDGVEYALLAEEGCRVEARSIALRQTPDYVTVTGYNCHRDPVREAYYTTDGAPYTKAKGYAIVERDYNMADRVKAARYYDADGRPVLMNGDYFEIRYGYNRRGQRVREAYFDTDGAPMPTREGYAALEREYDAYGNACVLRYYGVDGQGVVIDSGYAELRREFDDKKQVILERYYGVDGQPIAMEGGHLGVALSYDEAGNVISRRYLDGEGNLMTIAKGYAELRRRYNERGLVAFEAYFDEGGAPVVRAGGYAALEREYDDAGNACVLRYLGADGQSVVIASGYAELHREYNRKKQKLGESYYGADGRPIALKGGYYGYEQTFDDAGNMASRRYLGADGRPVVIAKGYAELRRRYNSRKQVVWEAYFDAEGNPTACDKGYAAVETTYGEGGASRRYYDAAGDPIDER